MTLHQRNANVEALLRFSKVGGPSALQQNLTTTGSASIVEMACCLS